ncbi:MAG: putative phage abortive infection protein [Methylocystaceae bacterium]|nr:putative phage abortive infection protein [Methylocystaceae bacterium]
MNSRTITGITLSILWLVPFIWLFHNSFESLYAVDEKTHQALNYLDFSKVGSFLAGVISPLALIWFVIAYLMQKDEMVATQHQLEKQAKELKKQNFESTFFSLINSFSNIVNTMSVTVEHEEIIDTNTFTRRIVLKELKGRDAIRENCREISNLFDPVKNPLTVGEVSPLPNVQDFESSYNELWNERIANCLGHYYRMMNRIIEFVDGDGYFHFRAKRKYVVFLRSHLSDDELFLLFMNTLTEKGKPMIEYAVKYNLFDNFSENIFITPPQYIYNHFYDIKKRSEMINELLNKQESKMNGISDYEPFKDKKFLRMVNEVSVKSKYYLDYENQKDELDKSISEHEKETVVLDGNKVDEFVKWAEQHYSILNKQISDTMPCLVTVGLKK